MTRYSIFLDDEREVSFIKKYIDLYEENWFDFWTIHIVRNIEQFKKILDKYIIAPVFISFDHDLWIKDNWKLEEDGYDIAKMIVNIDIDKGNFPKFNLNEDFIFNVHSMNPIWAENIKWYLNNYLKFKFNK